MGRKLAAGVAVFRREGACRLPEPVVALTVRLGERLFRAGFRYAKSGVMITELLPEAVQQPALWSELDRE